MKSLSNAAWSLLLLSGMMFFATSCEEADISPPVLTLFGDTLMIIERGTSFTDPGFDAQDQEEGDLNASVQVTGQVESGTAGSYLIGYIVTDKAGNVTKASRRVVVRHTAASLTHVYSALDSCVAGGTTGPYTCFINFTPAGDDSTVTFFNFHDNTVQIDLGATLRDETHSVVVIPSQTVSGFTISGTGTVADDGSVLMLSLGFSTTSQQDSCFSVWTRL